MALAAASAPQLGIYVHVPFCRQICSYCDFNVRRLPSHAPWEALGRAIDHELATRSPVYDGPATSVYLGGGTPSLAPIAFIAARLAAIERAVGIAEGCEITLEADPGTVDAGYLRALRDCGVARLSLGWQSTDAAVLQILGRQHDPAMAQALIDDARSAGFDNINVDLIYAVPTQTMAQLEADLVRLATIAPEHVSPYSLTYAPKTRLTRRVERNELCAPSESVEIDMAERIAAHCRDMGLAQYEVSNYARASFASRHNLGYWQGAPYLGIGPGAHSFLPQPNEGGLRWESVRSVSAYLAAWDHVGGQALPQAQEPGVSFVERLGPKERAYERLLMGLRRPTGLDLAPLHGALPALERHAQALVAAGLATLADSWLVPTTRGLMCADATALLCASD